MLSEILSLGELITVMPTYLKEETALGCDRGGVGDEGAGSWSKGNNMDFSQLMCSLENFLTWILHRNLTLSASP